MRSRLLGIILVLTAVGGFAADKVWTGAVDSNWSESGNWDPSAPGTADTAVFDATSAVNCTIDVDVEVAAVRIESTYTGTVSGGSATLTVNTGSFDASAGHFAAGTGTLKFTGSSGTQELKAPNNTSLNIVINAQTGGSLKLSYNHWYLEKLDLRPGTTTRIPPFRNTNVDDLLVQGTSGNHATIKSYNTGGAFLVVPSSGTYDIDYAEIGYVNASRGVRLYADDCVDLGGNIEVDFGTYDYCTWTGGGTTNNWSEAANWRPGVPQSFSAVHFSDYGTKNCTIDMNVDIAGLEIESGYTGAVSGGSAVIEINSGNFRFTSSSFLPQTSTVKFTGTGTQDQTYGISSTVNFHKLENAQTGGKLKCAWLTTTNIDEFVGNAGTVTELSHGYHWTNFDALKLNGVDGNPVTLRTTQSGSQTRVVLAGGGTQQIAYAVIQDLNAENGDRIYAGITSTDGGNNVNIDFSQVTQRTWTGGGTTNNWSEAANWSASILPAAVSEVRFDATGAKNCTIDVNVDIKALIVSEGYTGTIAAGSSTITINTGDITVAGGLNAGTSTVKFSGSENQKLEFTTPYKVENAKTGGELIFKYDAFTMDRLKLNTGTTTVLPSMGRPVTLNHLEILGESGSIAVVRTLDAGGVVRVKLQPGGTQTVRYADLRDIDASNGCAIDATDNCVDSSGNQKVYFQNTRVWDGGGVDTALSTAANWRRDIAPVNGDQLVFDQTTTKACSFDQNLTVTSLQILGYTGSIDFGTNTVTVQDDIRQDNNCTLSNGNLVFAGAGRQDVKFYSIPSFTSMTISNTAEYVNFTREGFSTGSLTLNAGAKVRMPSNKTVTATAFAANGTQQAPVIIDTYGLGAASKLNAAGTPTAQYTAVRGSDASGGTAINATTQCADGGNNSNWSFDQQNQLITSIVYFPGDSPVSPASVEGQYFWFTDTSSVAIDGAGAPVAGHIASDTFFYGDAPLNADGTATDVTVTFNGQSGSAKTAQVTWTPTDLVTAADLNIRKDDSLLLTAAGTGTTLTIDADGDGTADYTGAPGDKFAYQYSTAGTYTAEAKIDSVSVGTVQVTVISVDLGTARLGLQVGEWGPRTVTIAPAAAAAAVHFGAADFRSLEVDTSSYAPMKLRVYQTGSNNSLVARLGSASGPVITHQQINAFNLTWSSTAVVPIIKRYGDGDALVGGGLTMEPFYDGVHLRMHTNTSGILFENGTTTNDFTSDDMDKNGQIPYYLVMPEDGRTCHSIEVTEGGE